MFTLPIEVRRKSVLLYVAIASDGKTIMGSGTTPSSAKKDAESLGYYGKTTISITEAEIITYKKISNKHA